MHSLNGNRSAECGFGFALPPHHEAAQTECHQTDDRKQADELVGEAEELSLVSCDACADKAVKPWLGVEVGAAENCSRLSIEHQVDAQWAVARG